MRENLQRSKIKRDEHSKGITLVALVITIIILIILAGVSINLVLGENGLFTRARQAVEDFNQKAIEEKLQILYAEQLIDENSKNATTTKDATSLLEEIVGEGKITQKNIEQFNKYLEKYNQKVIGISSKDELLKIGKDDTHPLSGIYVQLSDIVYEEAEKVERIGTEKPFTGVYNGNGKKIQNLNVNVTNGNSGMFGVNTGTIKNVTIENCTINAEYARVGAIAGSNNGLIENCIISGGNINSNGDDDGCRLGGICGQMNDGGIIRNCRNYASVTGESKLVGGICGYNRGGDIENCTNGGTVEGKDYQVGGITGDSQGIDKNNISNIKNCINEGSVSSTCSFGESSFVGGIVGYNMYSTVSNCINKGKVEGTLSYVGGIVGVTDVEGIITQCQNLNEVISATDYVGGITGALCGRDTISLCYNAKDVSGKTYIGGIAGIVRVNNFINNSYNEGNVTAEDNYVGGLVGTTRSLIEKCCNTGKITLNSTTNQYIGGLFGYVYTSDVSVDKFKNCYYLEGTVEKACGNQDNIEGAISKKENEMPSLADILGNEFASSVEDN